MHLITVRDYDSVGDVFASDDEYHRVRFKVRSPIADLPKGDVVRLHEDEGWIDVYVIDGMLEVRGAQRLSIEPTSANQVLITLADVPRTDI
jgi:hypothetical protein